MTHRAQNSRCAPRGGCWRWLTIATFAGAAAACDGARDADSAGDVAGGGQAGSAEQRDDSVTTVRVRSVGGDRQGAPAGVAAQPDSEQGGGQAQPGGQQGGGQASQQGSGGAAQGDVSLQAASNVEDQVRVASFSPTAPAESDDEQGRLPAEGDLSMFIPITTLFPGSARLDPGVENPYAGDPDAIAAGERHFNAFNCSGCHAPLAGGGMGPPLSDDEWIFGNDPEQWYLVIMHGGPEGMPAFGSMLPRRAVWELAAYIDTLDEIENYATHLGFDAEHATSPTLPSRQQGWQSNERQAQQ